MKKRAFRPSKAFKNVLNKIDPSERIPSKPRVSNLAKEELNSYITQMKSILKKITPLEAKMSSKHPSKGYAQSIKGNIEDIIQLLPSEHVYEIESSIHKFQTILSTNTKMSTLVGTNSDIKYSDKIKSIVESIRKVDWGLNLPKRDRMSMRIKTQIQRGKSKSKGLLISKRNTKVQKLELANVKKENNKSGWKGWSNRRKLTKIKVIQSARREKPSKDSPGMKFKSLTPLIIPKKAQNKKYSSSVPIEELVDSKFFSEPVSQALSPIRTKQTAIRRKKSKNVVIQEPKNLIKSLKSKSKGTRLAAEQNLKKQLNVRLHEMIKAGLAKKSNNMSLNRRREKIKTLIKNNFRKKSSQ